MDSKRPASSPFQTPTQTPRKLKKRKVLSSATKKSKLESDRRRSKTRVNLGKAFNKWRDLRSALGLKRDPQLAFFLIKRYKETVVAPSTSTPHHQACTSTANILGIPHPPSSVTAGESDRDDFLVAGVQPLKEDEGLGLLEESFKSIELQDISKDDQEFYNLENSVIEFEEELDTDPYDSDYVPPISLLTGVPMLQSTDELPIIGLEEAVIDIGDRDEPADETPEKDLEEDAGDSASGISNFPSLLRVFAETDLINQQACISYTQNLIQLASFLQLPIKRCNYINHSTGVECGGRPPFNVQLRVRGTAVILEWFCPHQHKLWIWNSQPLFKHGMQGGDFMLASNILLSGNNYSKIALLFKFLNIKMVSSSTHYGIQHFYCVPAVRDFWTEKRDLIINALQTKDSVVVLADGRMDSPGHSAMYCTYTSMELETRDIINVVTIDKRHVGRKSTLMEKDAFIKTFDVLLRELNIKEIVTDAHVQIASLMHPEKGRYKEKSVLHSLDVWHAAKNLTKRLHVAGMMSGQKSILAWIKDIVNHFWFTCQHANNRDEFMGVWRGVLHHVSGVHEWALGRCLHGPLCDQREVIPPGSKAHVALSQIVLNRRWLKDIEKFLTFRTTSQLESFQNHILMYAGKRFAFTFEAYEARTFLAALDYNHHNNRPVHVNSKGQVMQKRLYSKKSQRYRVQAVKEAKDYSYIPDLQRKILGLRLQSAGGLPRKRSYRPDDPRLLGPISGIVPPPTADLLQSQVQRGQEMPSVP